MDIYSRIKDDHDRMRAVMSDLCKTDSTARRADLFRQLHDNLIAHSLVEQRIFYRPVMETDAAETKVMEGFNEHHLIDNLLEEINMLSPDTPAWMPKVQVLCELLEHHMKEEEEDLFEKAREAIDDDRAEELGKQFDRRKQQIVQALTPL